MEAGGGGGGVICQAIDCEAPTKQFKNGRYAKYCSLRCKGRTNQAAHQASGRRGIQQRASRLRRKTPKAVAQQNDIPRERWTGARLRWELSREAANDGD